MSAPVKKDAAEELEAARRHLSDATEILGIKIYGVAARESYYAAFHAAQALIAKGKGEVSRTHKGVSAVIGELTAGTAFEGQKRLDRLYR